MTDHFKATREATIAKFVEHAAALFAANPARRSVMLAVSQYWNDSANDEVHGWVVASTRRTPAWPHECDSSYDEVSGEATRGPLLAGEECWLCGDGDRIEMSFYGGYGDAMVSAFEVFCRESAHQGMEVGEAYVPFAIARRGEELEIVGRPLRPPTAMIDSAAPGYTWPDDRARALFDEVCRSAGDDAPRAVLADYLLERGDVRGEAIGLALANELDDEARARRDELFQANAERWLFPLGDVIPAGCAHFERGFLARVVVSIGSVSDRKRVEAAPAWGTVHTLRFAPESRDIVSPAMRALRDVGPCRGDGVAAIAHAEHIWSIETLRVASSVKHLEPLMRARNLPRLAHLEVSTVYRDVVETMLRKAPWRDHLERLVFVAAEYGSLADWRALRKRLEVPELAIAIAPYWSDLASSWEIGFRADESVAVRGADFHADTRMLPLAELLGQLPDDTRIELVSTRNRDFDDADATWLREYTGRAVTVSSGRVTRPE
jgi:uncharacterized protein (TIGR02996 family)